MSVALNNTKSGFSLEDKFDKVITGTGKEGEKGAHTDTHTHTDTHIIAPAKENQTKRTFGTVRPSVFEKVSRYAAAQGTSYNAIVCDLLDEFIEKKGL